MFSLISLFELLRTDFQKQPSRGGLNLQSSFIEITLWHGCSPVNSCIFSEQLFLRTPLDVFFWIINADIIILWKKRTILKLKNFSQCNTATLKLSRIIVISNSTNLFLNPQVFLVTGSGPGML